MQRVEMDGSAGMPGREVPQLALIEAFNAAAFDPNGWYSALEQLADATGSRSAELISVHPDPASNLHVITNFDFEAAFGAYQEAGGDDPRFNPRVRAGLKAAALEVLTESDFLPPEEYERNPHFQEFCLPWDIPFSCLSTLEHRDGGLLGLAVFRSKRQGHITDRQRGIFAAVAPFVRSSVRAQVAMESRGSELLAHSMEALSIPAFICDRRRQVRALTAAAEAVVSGDAPLDVKTRQLHTAAPADLAALNDAIDVATDPERQDRPILQTVVIRGDEDSKSPLVLDVMAVPRGDYELGFAPRVLIVIRGRRNADARRIICRAVFGLTAAETEIALQLADGHPPDAIASARCVSVGTVRVQIKAILSKLGLKRQIELVARVNRL
jgi:DNA-binding CsgD family transcriptional regulator